MKLTKEDLNKLIADEVAKHAPAFDMEEVKKAIDEKVAELKKPNGDKVVTGDDGDGSDPKGGFYNFAEFAQAVAKAEKNPRNIDKRLVALEAKAAGAGLTELVDSEGGFLIPTEFRAQLLKLAEEKSNLMARCMDVPMTVNSINLPYIKGVDRSGGYIHGAIKLYWIAEEAVKDETKPKFGQVTLTLHELAGFAYTSNQILEDSPISLEPLLTDCFSDAFAWTMDNVLLNGTGAGQPMGILVAPCLIGITKETGQAADTIVFENIVKMESRLLPASEKNAIYLANKNTFPQLATMKIAVGTGGVPVYLPAGGASGKPYKTLMGRPLIFTEHCQKLGDKGDIYLADFSQYLLGQKKGRGIKADTSMHLKFDYDQMAFRFTFRVDGQPWLPSAVTPRYATSDTLSPFVTLNART
ncbi:MAG: phage major capsid protein [Desulfobacterales bacterium]|nr:phage major capsid protein [Desulfobacterales bacterium]